MGKRESGTKGRRSHCDGFGCLCGGRNRVGEKSEMQEVEIKRERERESTMTNASFLPAGAACNVLCISSFSDKACIDLRCVCRGGGGGVGGDGMGKEGRER